MSTESDDFANYLSPYAQSESAVDFSVSDTLQEHKGYEEDHSYPEYVYDPDLGCYGQYDFDYPQDCD